MIAKQTKAQEIGRRIAQARRQKAVRDEADVRPVDVARALGVSQATVSDWEAGKTTPRDELMEPLADFLGVTPAYLRYGVSEANAALSSLQPAERRPASDLAAKNARAKQGKKRA